MRLAQLRIKRARPYWILSPIRLSKNQPVSPFLNIDLLTDKQKEIIDKAAEVKDIQIVDASGRVVSSLDRVNYVPGEVVDTSDVLEPEEIEMPELVSITVDMDEEEEEEEPEQGIPDTLVAEATILLERNGNTVKAAIGKLDTRDDALMFLHACLQVETDGKKRKGVLYAIQKAITEH